MPFELRPHAQEPSTVAGPCNWKAVEAWQTIPFRIYPPPEHFQNSSSICYEGCVSCESGDGFVGSSKGENAAPLTPPSAIHAGWHWASRGTAAVVSGSGHEDRTVSVSGTVTNCASLYHSVRRGGRFAERGEDEKPDALIV
jgi:hypothetical protein